MLMAAGFAAKVLNMPEDDLITIILIIQVVAVIGAWLTSMSSAKYGNTRTLIALVIIWTAICMCVYFVANAVQF